MGREIVGMSARLLLLFLISVSNMNNIVEFFFICFSFIELGFERAIWVGIYRKIKMEKTHFINIIERFGELGYFYSYIARPFWPNRT